MTDETWRNLPKRHRTGVILIKKHAPTNNIRLAYSRSFRPSLVFWFSHIARYAPSPARLNLTEICDPCVNKYSFSESAKAMRGTGSKISHICSVIIIRLTGFRAVDHWCHAYCFTENSDEISRILHSALIGNFCNSKIGGQKKVFSF